jgi:microcystin degradation protein MlrC
MTLPALVITAEFWHETNTFNHRLTALQDMTVLDGEEALAERGSTNTELAGFLVAAGRHSWDLTHVLSVMGNPAGRLLDRDFWEVLKRIEAAVGHARQKGGPSGILVALHGSLSTESLDDGDGAFLNRLRDVAGPDVPIVATLDLHANVSAQMAAAVDALVSYKTYPHIDMLETGNKAGNVLDKLMREKCRGRVLIARRPMLEEASGGRTDMPLMEARLAKAADHETSHADALDVSINAGMAWADVANIGPSVTASVLSGTREAPHQALIQSLADDIWEHRQHQSHHFLDPAEAAARAAAHSADRAPLVISDYTDNPCAGAPGDATNLLAALLKAGVRNACLGGLVDPEAVKVLEHYSIGDRVTLDIGGRCSPHHGGGPVTVSGRLSCISAGSFVPRGAIWTSLPMSFGPVAVPVVDGIKLLSVSRPIQLFDPQQFRQFGIEPEDHAVIVVKSMDYFRANFSTLASAIITCDSGGIASQDYGRLSYSRVPRPIYPLDPVVKPLGAVAGG